MTREAHARLTELFGEAIELPSADRIALIERVRADDPVLAAELGALLEADRARASALETGRLGQRDPSTESTIRAATGEPTRVDTPHSIRNLNVPMLPGYRVLGVLGQGGMGTVYEAEQEAPRRTVAIKVLSTTSDAALMRFRTEIEIMARLDHPGIAKIFEAGHANGHPYFVMERVDGVMLDVHVAKLTRPARLALFAAICDAVHHAHIKGVFHRDLKPSNVMVRPDGRVAVLDFGIARVTELGCETRAGELVGTPVYMSPEQARLRADEVDARSDVYTLGVMLYELLADRLPYEVRGKSLPEIARAICNDPMRPLDRSLRGDLEAICDRALQKEPERRYASAAMLADDIRRHLEGARVSVRVPGTVEQVRRFVRRRPGVAAAVLAGIAGSVVVTALWLEARAARRSADLAHARVVAAHATLEERTNQLLLDQARRALTTDPTHSLALLQLPTARGVDAREAWAIANEAFGRGVASHVNQAHQDEVHWIEPAPGGFVTASYDGRVRRWSAGVIAELAHVSKRAHVVRPSPDGRLFAIGFDSEARIVDETGHTVATPGPLDGDIDLVAWSPSGTHVAFADDRGAVLLWDRTSATVTGTLDVISGVESIAWDRNGTALAIGTEGDVVWRWDVTRDTKTSIKVGSEPLAVWCDGDRVAAVLTDGRMQRWQLRGDQLTATGEVATGITGKKAAVSADGSRALVGGVDGRVAYISDATVQSLAPHPRQVRAVALTADGQRFATASDDGLIRVWNLTTPRMTTLRGHAQRVRHLAFSADATELLSADGAGEVRRWAIDRMPPTVFEPHDPITRIAIAADGWSVVTADAAGELRRFSFATGASTLIGVHPNVSAVAAGSSVASYGADTLMGWGSVPTSGVLIGPYLDLAMSPNWVAVASAAGSIALLSADYKQREAVSGHAGGTDAVAFSPDGSLLVSGGQDRVVRVWDPAAPSAPLVELGPIDDDTRHIVFARNGAIVATAGDDGKVRTWSVRGRVVDPASQRVLATHQGAVIALASDGADRLVSVGRDRVRIEIDLAGGSVARHVAKTASQPIEGGASTLRGVRLPIRNGRDIEISADGAVLVVHDVAHRDYAALQTRLKAR